MISTRRAVVKTLQTLRLNRVASEAYYRYFHRFDSVSPDRVAGFERLYAAVDELGSLADADYCEFGLFKGFSFWKAQEQANKYGWRNTRFFGFDSFAGLPEIEAPDRTAHGEFRKGQYECTKQDVIRHLKRAGGIDWSRTFLIEGFFKDTLIPGLVSEYRIERVGVAMIDCDLYTSTAEVLQFLGPLMDEGTVLIMDDWNSYSRDDSRGQRRAMSEFLGRRPDLRLEPLLQYGHNSEAFVIRRRR
jgi:O-methyltransferase